MKLYWQGFLVICGLGTITGNYANTETLLAKQVAEFYLARTAHDVHTILRTGLGIVPRFLHATVNNGILAGTSEQLTSLIKISHDCQNALQNCHEVLELFQAQINSGAAQ